MQAETAALALISRDVVRPPWAEHVGAVTAGECYVNSDAFGIRDEVVCVYSYAGAERTPWSWSWTTTPAGCSATAG